MGFKGNYIIFPMKGHNALTEFMAAPYVDDAFGAMDPDQLSHINIDEFSEFICCLHDRVYDLRHTHATLLLMAKENPKVVGERLGHSTIVLTLDTYRHVLPTMQRNATDKLEKLLFA